MCVCVRASVVECVSVGSQKKSENPYERKTNRKSHTLKACRCIFFSFLANVNVCHATSTKLDLHTFTLEPAWRKDFKIAVAVRNFEYAAVVTMCGK